MWTDYTIYRVSLHTSHSFHLQILTLSRGFQQIRLQILEVLNPPLSYINDSFHLQILPLSRGFQHIRLQIYEVLNPPLSYTNDEPLNRIIRFQPNPQCICTHLNKAKMEVFRLNDKILPPCQAAMQIRFNTSRHSGLHDTDNG